jgi:alkanesulfonate monooxygenase SsuD/methylene tetrahydromethanopterin reductase-like flavin-dependent oxidoreductase (luciferase family)
MGDVAVNGVEFGILVPQVAYSYDEIVQRARWIEELGFHSMWLMDHLYPPGLPDVGSFEAWTLATALLTATTRLRVGHMVLCNNFRHPTLLAKMASTLDAISDGRLILGLGSGSFAEEHHRAGMRWAPFAERSARLGESLELVSAMFTNERTTYAGDHYAVDDLPNVPPPVQRPRPPILVGGSGDRTLDLVARHADYWNCPTYALDELDALVARLHAACARVGRDPAAVRISLEAVLALAPDEEVVPGARALAERRFGFPGYGLHALDLIGTPEVIVERLCALVARGVRLFVFFLHDRVQRATLELLADEVVPAVSAFAP